jgi:phage tail-like protein
MSAPSAQRLTALLPAIYREQPFLGRYLAAFEQVLLGLEKTIDGFATLFDPQETRSEFLPWLASWTALTLRADLDLAVQRNFTSNIIRLYRRRGTKANLEELLELFTRGVATVGETAAEFQIGVHSTIAVNTNLGGGPPHFFRVTIRLAKGEPAQQLRQVAIARELIELEKPAHTDYTLDVVFPTMQIGKSSTLGVDTILGTGTDDPETNPG